MIGVDATPYLYTFDPKTTALIVIDMQRDFLESGGFGESLGNDISRLTAIVSTTVALLDLCRSQKLLIVHTKEAHKADLSDCPSAKRTRGNAALQIGDEGPMGRILIAGEPGNDIVEDLRPLDGETVIKKPGKGAFYNTQLAELLTENNISHLIFAGVTTEVCVQTSMREANDRGYECLLIEDCTESYFPAFKQATLEMIAAQGAIVGWTAKLEILRAGMEGN